MESLGAIEMSKGAESARSSYSIKYFLQTSVHAPRHEHITPARFSFSNAQRATMLHLSIRSLYPLPCRIYVFHYPALVASIEQPPLICPSRVRQAK